MDCRLIHTEQYTRRECLVISGIPDNISQRELEGTVLHILHTVGVKFVSSYHISACHRLFKHSNDKNPARTMLEC